MQKDVTGRVRKKREKERESRAPWSRMWGRNEVELRRRATGPGAPVWTLDLGL